MKKILNRLALLLSMLAGFGFILASCAVHGSGGAFDKDEDNGNGGELTDAEIIEQYPNQFMFRYNGSSSDQFSDDAPYSITDFGKPDATTGLAGGGVFRYYPTAIDLSADTAEFSAVVKPNVDEGQQGVGFVQVSDGKVVGWWLVTTHNKIRYWNPNNAVESSKTSENGSGWDAGTKKDITSWTTGTEYTVKINLKTLTGSAGDTGEKGFEVLVYEGESTTAAYEKYAKYGRWLTPDANSKIYFAIGTTKNDSSNTTWSNITAKVNDGETYTMKKIVDVQDQSAMKLADSDGNAVTAVIMSSGDTVTYTYSAKDKDGGDVEPTVSCDNNLVTVTKNPTAKTITITAGASAGSATVTILNEEGTGNPSVEVSVTVLVPGTIKLDGNVKTDDFVTVFNSIASDSDDHTITLGVGGYVVPVGSALEYTGTGTLTIEGDTSTEYGSDVLIVGNPNNNTESTRNLLYLKGNGNFVLKNITVKNIYNLSTDCQAEALASNGTGKIVAYNSSFLSHQDTIRTTGKAWFYKCYIAGDVDFLWMEESGIVALYEECELHMLGDRAKSAYIVAPRATKQTTIGLGVVVLNSKITIDEGVDAYLFRNPWYSSDATKLADAKAKYYNQAAFVGTTVASSSPAQLNTALEKSGAFGVGDESVVGWKTDGVLTATGVGTIAASELTTGGAYSNRGYILNKLVKIDSDTETAVYKSDSTIWDVSSYNFATGTENPEPEAFDETCAMVTWNFEDIAPASDGTTLNGGVNTFAGTIANYSGDKSVNLDVRFGPEAWGTTKIKAWDSTNNRAESYNVILTVPVTPGATLTIPNTNGSSGFFYNNGTTTEQLAAKGTLSWKNSGASTVNVVVWSTTDKSYFSTVKLEDYDLTQIVTTTSAARFIAIIVGSDSIAANAEASVVARVIGSYGFDSTSATANLTASGANATLTDGKLAGDGSTTGTATITATYETITDTKEVTITEALSWDSAELYTTKNASSGTAGGGTGLVDSDWAGTNKEVFTLSNVSAGFVLGSETRSFNNLAGEEVSVSAAYKSQETVSFTVDKAATVTVLQAYTSTNSKTFAGYLTCTSSDGGVATMTSGATSAISADTSYTWTLTAGTYIVTRNSSENTGAIYYIKVVKN